MSIARLMQMARAGAGGDAGWNISTASYVQGFSVSGQEVFPRGIFFKPDGLKMYVVGSLSDIVVEYNLSTAWDVSTASFLQSFSVADLEGNPHDVFFKPDGLKMYVVGLSIDTILEYSLSPAWDVSTASYTGNNFSVAAQATSPQGLFFKPDGTKMYIANGPSRMVLQYTLSTGFDLNTASYDSVSFRVEAQDGNPTAVFFRDDGLKMYVTGQVSDSIHEYDLATAWDVSTASFLQSFSVAVQETSPQGLFFKPDGSKVYVVGLSTVSILEYDL